MHLLKQPCRKNHCYGRPQVVKPPILPWRFLRQLFFHFHCTFDCSWVGAYMYHNRKKFISPGCVFSPSLARYSSRFSFDDRVGIKVLNSLLLLLKGLNLISLHCASLYQGLLFPCPRSPKLHGRWGWGKGKPLGGLQGGSVLLIRLLPRSHYHPQREEGSTDRWTDLEEDANIFRNVLHSVGTALTSLVSH